MLVTFFRAIILYFLVLIVMRLMGKREIGQLQPFELTISIMISDLASIPMADIGIPLINGIVPIISLLLVHLLISFFDMKSTKVREFISGKPSILIYRGKIIEDNLKKERYTINDLEEKLRDSNVMSLCDVEHAILETNGNITIIQKSNKRNLTPEDLDMKPKYEDLPYDLVIDGKVMYENLNKINKDYSWLKNQTKAYNIIPEEALVVMIDGQQNIYVQAKQNKNKSKNKS